MGEEERLNAVSDELGLLLDELRSLAANRDAAVYRKCISNLYYASLHAVRAILLAHGLEARTPEGTQRLFAGHFVKAGAFDQVHLKTLARLEADRLRADYQGFHQFGAEDLEQTLGPVTALVTAALDYLQEREPALVAQLGVGIRQALARVTHRP
jgi:uncharacterized protein (UPF0332 family)